MSRALSRPRSIVRRRPRLRIGLDGAVMRSRDGGGVKCAVALQDVVGTVSGIMLDFAFTEKRRVGGGVSRGLFAGAVAGRQIFVVDDMFVGAGTMLLAAQAARAHGGGVGVSAGYPRADGFRSGGAAGWQNLHASPSGASRRGLTVRTFRHHRQLLVISHADGVERGR